MRTIYVDSECKCHVGDDGTRLAVETEFFDGKCDTFVEGYLLVPMGRTWAREDGEVFTGEMISPWSDCNALEAEQAQHDRAKLQEYELLINELYEEVL